MRWLLTIGLLFYVSSASSQTPAGDNGDKPTNFSDVAGNPYLFREWSDGLVRFSSGRVLNQFKLKFDCAQNRLMLQFNGSTFAAESKVSEFVIFQKNGRKTDSLVFRKGFPNIGRATAETYYQVLCEGRATLLQLFNKNIIEDKQLGAMSMNRRYQDEDKLYLLFNNTMTEIVREKNALLELLPDQADALKHYIDVNDLRMKSAADITRIVQKYNELVQ